MKTAFISDVHGNLEAFTSVCESIKQEHVDRIVFLGDIVGYGANPNECIELLQSLTNYAAAGNHDWAAAGRQSAHAFNAFAAEALEWTRATLTRENMLFLRSLPLSLDMREFLGVHASPSMPDRWRYVFNALDAEAVFGTFSHRLCFIAHTHCPVIFEKLVDAPVVPEFPAMAAFHPCGRYIINCGSVGQPRDGDPRASYGVYDTSDNRYHLVRVEYDLLSVQKKIRRAGLPDYLAYRLSVGR
ncbi:MAG: metallophosphoesterase family protein [Deltaproteobacteria bacterium]|nr:metallophosphoesterase family protein [Deltaproteobacteria bacterium]